MRNKQAEVGWEHPLPVAEPENSFDRGFYYKHFSRRQVEPVGYLTEHIGLKVFQFSPYQLDHIVYFVQKVNSNLQWCRLIITGHRWVFIETSIGLQAHEESQPEFVARERQVFNKLRTLGSRIEKLLNQELNLAVFLSPAFGEQNFRLKLEQMLEDAKLTSLS